MYIYIYNINFNPQAIDNEGGFLALRRMPSVTWTPNNERLCKSSSKLWQDLLDIWRGGIAGAQINVSVAKVFACEDKDCSRNDHENNQKDGKR